MLRTNSSKTPQIKSSYFMSTYSILYTRTVHVCKDIEQVNLMCSKTTLNFTYENNIYKAYTEHFNTGRKKQIHKNRLQSNHCHDINN